MAPIAAVRNAFPYPLALIKFHIVHIYNFSITKYVYEYNPLNYPTSICTLFIPFMLFILFIDGDDIVNKVSVKISIIKKNNFHQIAKWYMYIYISRYIYLYPYFYPGIVENIYR